MSDFSVRFNNYNLANIPHLEFVRRFPNEEPPVNIISHDLVRRDGSAVVSRRYTPKNISIEGFVRAPSRAAYEQTMDELKWRTSEAERPLLITQGGISRRYTATKDNLIHEHIGMGNARVNINFLCSDPFGRDAEQTIYEETAISSNNHRLGHTFGGTATAMPRFIVTVNSVTDGENQFIGIANSHTGQQVALTRDWVSGDVVEFNTDRKRVIIDGTIVDFTGVFPTFRPGQNTATYIDGFTDRDVDVRVVYDKQFI